VGTTRGNGQLSTQAIRADRLLTFTGGSAPARSAASAASAPPVPYAVETRVASFGNVGVNSRDPYVI